MRGVNDVLIHIGSTQVMIINEMLKYLIRLDWFNHTKTSCLESVIPAEFFSQRKKGRRRLCSDVHSGIQMCTLTVHLLPVSTDDPRSTRSSRGRVELSSEERAVGSQEATLTQWSGFILTQTGAGNLIRISEASRCKGIAFFPPTALSYWMVKGRYWPGRVFKAEVMSPVNQKENIAFSYGNLNLDSWHWSASVRHYRSRASVSADLVPSWHKISFGTLTGHSTDFTKRVSYENTLRNQLAGLSWLETGTEELQWRCSY